MEAIDYHIKLWEFNPSSDNILNVIYKRNRAGLNLLEYSALYGYPSDKLDLIYKHCPTDHLISTIAHTIWILYTTNRENVSYITLIERLSNQQLLQLLEHKIIINYRILFRIQLRKQNRINKYGTLIDRLLEYRPFNRTESADILIQIFKRFSDHRSLLSAITNVPSWTVYKVLRNQKLLQYLINILSPEQYLQVLSLTETDGMLLLNNLITGDIDIDNVLSPLNFSQIHQLLLRKNHNMNAFDESPPFRILSIFNLYNAKEHELLELCLNRYHNMDQRWYKPCIVRDCVTLYLIYGTSATTADIDLARVRDR